MSEQKMKSFKWNDEEYSIGELTNIIDREARKNEAIEYNKLLLSSVPTEAKLLDTISKQGIWTEDDEKELSDLHQNLAEMQVELEVLKSEKKIDKKKILDCTTKMIKLRSVILEKLNQRYSPLSMTCESMSKEIYYDTCVANMLYKDNKRVFDNYSDMCQKRDNMAELIEKATTALMETQKQMKIKDLPEIQARIELGLSDDEGNTNIEEIIKIYSDIIDKEDEVDDGKKDKTGVRSTTKRKSTRKRASTSNTGRNTKRTAKNST